MRESASTLMNKHYDNWMFGGENIAFDKIGFFNTGYWKGVEGSVEIAQINLIETLIDFFTERDGYILDVACGKGASTKFLTKYFDARRITGINTAERQLDACRVIAPECTFKLMDAAVLDFEECSFSNVLCIDSASHFSTRQKFFREAWRVLKSGGRLAMSDIVNDWLTLQVSPELHEANSVPNLDAYRDQLRDAGFRYVRVDDTTEYAIDAFKSFMLRRLERERASSRDAKTLENMKLLLSTLDTPVQCCMAFAIK